MMAASMHHFRVLPDRFMRCDDVTADRKHTDRRCQRRSPQTAAARPLFQVDVPAINCLLNPSNSHTLVLRKPLVQRCPEDDTGGEGFGFTLSGRCPAVVGRVESGSWADRGGLATGDRIERINGRNVSRSSAESIATIIRFSGDVIVVDVNRPTSSTSVVTTTTTKTTLSYVVEVSPPNSSADIEDHLSECSILQPAQKHVRRRSRVVEISLSGSTIVHDERSRSSRQRDSGYEECRFSQLCETAMGVKDDDRPEEKLHVVETETVHHRELSDRCGELRRNNGETIMSSKMAAVSECTSSTSSDRRRTRRRHDATDDVISFCKRLHSAQQKVDQGLRDSDAENRPPSTSSANDVLDVAFLAASGSSTRDFRRQRRRRKQVVRATATTLWDPSISVIQPVDCDDVRLPFPAAAAASPITDVTTSTIAMAESQRKRKHIAPETVDTPRGSRPHRPSAAEIVRQMALCERRFADVLSDGVSRLSRPLRHQHRCVDAGNDAIISRERNEDLFQNVEKLLVTSEYVANKLSQIESRSDVVTDVAALYSSQLCAAYKQYCDGLPVAKRTLAELKSNRPFSEFLQMAAVTERAVEDFITRPLQHIHNVRYWLSRLLYASPTTSSNNDAVCKLGDILASLDEICDPEVQVRAMTSS